MTKRTILLIGIPLLFSAVPAHAQICPPSPIVEMMANKTPLGEYTKAVIERVDAGIQEAEGSGGGSGGVGSNLKFWLGYITGAIYELLDTDVRLVEYQKDIKNISACLHMDLAILEAKMEQVRCKIYEQMDSGGGGMYQLIEIQRFINDRYRHLIKGATDPTYVDTEWQFEQTFDPPAPVWCCLWDDPEAECTQMDVDLCVGFGGIDFPTVDMCSNLCLPPEEESEEPPEREALCPFDTDYLPPTSSGYGCDISVMQSVNGVPSLQNELEGLEEFMQARESFLTAEGIGLIRNAYIRMLEFQGKPIPPGLLTPGTNVDVPHKKEAGCFDEDEAKKLPWGSISHATRGPFSLNKNHIEVIAAFFDLTQRWALLREIPYYLRPLSDFEEDTPEYDEAKERISGLAGFGTNEEDRVRKVFVNIHMDQGRQDTAIATKAVDTQLQLMQIMQPVRSVVATLAKSVTSPTQGMRAFAKNYAYFLRRSCIFRPCSERLDKVMKILFSDTCFPYTSGLYLKENNAPWWQQCEYSIQY